MSKIIENASEAVADLANALGSTVSSSKDATARGDESSAARDAVMASSAEGRRVYIGNLAYAATEGELTKFFEGYLVESTSLPKNPRSQRPVGYAFVDFITPDEAQRAIAELSGKEIVMRKVSLELARKPEPAAEKTEKTKGGETGSGSEGGRRRTGPGRGRGRGRNPRGSRASRANKQASNSTPASDKKDLPQEAGEVPASEDLPLTDNTNQTPADKEAKEEMPSRPAREPRERRERGPPADGIPSKVKVMVANLPYDLTEDQLKELFEPYEPSSAKIALRPIPRYMVKKLQARNEPRKSRGFGFVALGSEEQQQKAVEEMNGKEIGGREIAVKVAIDSPDVKVAIDSPDGEAAIHSPDVKAVIDSPDVAG